MEKASHPNESFFTNTFLYMLLATYHKSTSLESRQGIYQWSVADLSFLCPKAAEGSLMAGGDDST
jgi:hypothetical protein